MRVGALPLTQKATVADQSATRKVGPWSELVKNLSRNSRQKLPVVALSRGSNFDDLQP
jgi:hypothetical protein